MTAHRSMPGGPGRSSVMRLAWLGRTSTDDLQDPTLSLPRQLATSTAALPPGAVIIAHFYDVESGRKDIELRGRGTAHEAFNIPIPRDGGIQDLLTEARRPNCRFDAVICESIDRVARRTYFGTKVEYELERAGITLLAADEPMSTTGKRATAILTRRVKQGVAEWYVLETLEKSWDGFIEHTHQGWNVGRPPYGYLADRVPHPVPGKRADGATKTRLTPDPIRGPVVRHIYDLYLGTGMGISQIADALNTDPASYPPPTPVDPARAIGVWSRSSVWEVLRNPKYTGHQVWNRRGRKTSGNRINPPDAWIWSEHPTHPPLITRDEHNAVQTRAAANARSRRSDSPRGAGPADGITPDGSPPERKTRGPYLYRSRLRCPCALRMTGNTRRAGAAVYYFCQPRTRQQLDRPAAHPGRTIYLNEQRLHTAVTDWLATAVFGPDRNAYWHACLTSAATADTPAAESLTDRLSEHEHQITDLDRRIQRQVLNLEDDDLSPEARRHITVRIRQLEASITQHQDHAATIRDQLAEQPATIDEITDLLRHLSQLADELPRQTHDQLRALYDALELRVQYQPDDDAIDIDITVADVPPPTTASQFWSVRPVEIAPGRRRLVRVGSRVSLSSSKSGVRN